MEEQKYCIKHKLSNGTYLAVLNNGWRYDGSVVVEADTERELEYKLLQARYDDRWVTLNGSHILIGGTGRIKSGAGGRLKGRMFGMNFSDYEHGKKSKKGKKLIRVYKPMKKTGESKKVVAGKGKAKSGAMQITKHEEVKNALNKAGFKVDNSFMTKVDKSLAVDNTNQLLSLERKFGVLKNTKVTITAERESSIASVGIFPTNPVGQTLYFSTNYFNSRDKLITTNKNCHVKDVSGQAFQMPHAEGKDSIYAITHEYGHLIQNMLIAQRFRKDGWKESNPNAFLNFEGAQKAVGEYYANGYSFAKAKAEGQEVYLKWYKDRQAEVVDQCRKEIIAIAKKNNKNFKLKDHISKYGSKITLVGKEEFFAEVFANSQLGAPNELGIAMQQWLVQKGLVINE